MKLIEDREKLEKLHLISLISEEEAKEEGEAITTFNLLASSKRFIPLTKLFNALKTGLAPFAVASFPHHRCINDVIDRIYNTHSDLVNYIKLKEYEEHMVNNTFKICPVYEYVIIHRLSNTLLMEALSFIDHPNGKKASDVLPCYALPHYLLLASCMGINPKCSAKDFWSIARICKTPVTGNELTDIVFNDESIMSHIAKFIPPFELLSGKRLEDCGRSI